jgi:hypothetical protein
MVEAKSTKKAVTKKTTTKKAPKAKKEQNVSLDSVHLLYDIHNKSVVLADVKQSESGFDLISIKDTNSDFTNVCNFIAAEEGLQIISGTSVGKKTFTIFLNTDDVLISRKDIEKAITSLVASKKVEK